MSDPTLNELARRLVAPLSTWFLSARLVRDLGRGTANPTDAPGGLLAGDRFFRTDLGFALFYDGTRWLSIQEYHAVFSNYVFGVAQGTAYGGGVPQAMCRIITRTDLQLYFTRFTLLLNCSVAQTAANNWRLNIQSKFGAVSHQLYNTNGQAAGITTVELNTITTPLNSNAPETRLVLDVKNGAPGTITVEGAAAYRLVVP